MSRFLDWSIEDLWNLKSWTERKVRNTLFGFLFRVAKMDWIGSLSFVREPSQIYQGIQLRPVGGPSEKRLGKLWEVWWAVGWSWATWDPDCLLWGCRVHGKWPSSPKYKFSTFWNKDNPTRLRRLRWRLNKQPEVGPVWSRNDMGWMTAPAAVV